MRFHTMAPGSFKTEQSASGPPRIGFLYLRADVPVQKCLRQRAVQRCPRERFLDRLLLKEAVKNPGMFSARAT
jgi:hypothetical protein